MVVEATLRIRHRGCATETFRDGTSMAQVSGDRGSELFVLLAEEPRRLDEALRVSERYVGARADVLAREEGAMLFRGVNRPDGIVASIRESRCAILWPLVYQDGEETYTLVAPDRRELRLLVERARRYGTVDLERVADVAPAELGLSIPLGAITAGLTARQRGTLLAAVRGGYFDSPRRAGSRELARAQRISPSTWKEHVRKAEGRVLARVAAALARGERLDPRRRR